MENLTGLTMARVVKWNQHDNSVDCQSLYDGGRWTAVPVMTGMITSSSGFVDWHEPEGNEWDKAGSSTRDVIAVIGKVHEQPIVMGFIARPVSEMLFKRKNFRVDRHSSDVYSTIDKDGNVEFSHPSGTFIRFAENPDHEDLAGKDWDRKWAISRNKTKRPWLSMQVANASGVKAVVKIDPDGNVTVKNQGTVTWESTGKMTFRADVEFVGPGLKHNGVNVGADHTHGGVVPGDEVSGAPE